MKVGPSKSIIWPASKARAACSSRSRTAQVTDVKLKIFEPPRFFEAFLRGRKFTEAPDITARICGICPVAYQMSACHAWRSLGVQVDGPIRALRRLIYCGEWIESQRCTSTCCMRRISSAMRCDRNGEGSSGQWCGAACD